MPPQLSDLLGNLLIAVDIRIKSMLPELDFGFGVISISAPFVPVPKTTMNKNNRFVAGENDTRLSK